MTCVKTAWNWKEAAADFHKMIILCSSSAGRQIEKWWRCQPTSYIVYACTENWKWSWAKVKGVKGVTVKKRGICVAVENQQQQHYNTSHQKCATIIKSNRPVARALFTLLFNVVMCLPTSTETTFAHTPDRKCVCVCSHVWRCWLLAMTGTFTFPHREDTEMALSRWTPFEFQNRPVRQFGTVW